MKNLLGYTRQKTMLTQDVLKVSEDHFKLLCSFLHDQVPRVCSRQMANNDSGRDIGHAGQNVSPIGGSAFPYFFTQLVSYRF